MKQYIYILFFLLFNISIVVSKTITTLDSAEIVAPTLYSNILSEDVLYEISPKCSVSKVILYVKNSLLTSDTIAILTEKPFKGIWSTTNLKDRDQLRLQFQYTIFHPNGDTIQSTATPHRWIKFTNIKSNKRTCISRHLDPDEEITIDGNLKEWKRVPANIISSNSYFKTRWTSSDFYFAIVVEDDIITPQDQVEISLDLKPDESPFFGINQRIFIFGPSRRSFLIAVDRKDNNPIQSDSLLIRVGEEMEWRSLSEKGQYFIETRIPFVLLSDLEFPPKTFGFDITVIDHNKQEYDIRSWNAQSPNSRQIKLNWGTIKLKQNFFPLKLTLLIGLFTFILLIIISSVIGLINREISKRKIKKMELSRVTKIILKSIEDEYSDPELTIKKVGQLTELSLDEIKDSLLNEMDSDYNSVLKGIRVDKSKYYLLNTDLTTEEISLKCGFKETEEFDIAFKTIMKSDPQSWREGREEEDVDEDLTEDESTTK